MSSIQISKPRSAFFRFFPPPDFLLSPAVGVDISDRAVRFIELRTEKGGNKIKKFGEQALPKGVIQNGDIKDKATLKTALIALRKDYDLSYIRVGLPEERAFLFRMEVPILSHEETVENISFSLEEHIPLSSADAVFDYVVSKPLYGKVSPGNREVVVSAIPREVVSMYESAFLDSGLTPLSFEIEGSAIARSVIPFSDSKTYMVVDIGAFRTGIVVVCNNVVYYSTTVDFGGNIFNELIQTNLNVSSDEAEALIQEGAFSRQGDHRDFFPVLLNASDPLKEEISKHYVYWHNHQNKKECTPPPIEKVLICGSDAGIDGLAEHLTLSLRSKVDVADVWANAFSVSSYIPPIPFNKSLAFATATGLALRRD